MKLYIITALVGCIGVFSSLANAGGADKLIALDKAWGSASGPDDAKAMISDKLISVDKGGVTGKAELMKDLASADAPDGPYVAGDYKVQFLDDDTAVMVHSAGTGDDAHWSMHVWQKSGGKWQVAATASVEAD